ncbi:MAG: c-type cytochrome [Flavobacteriaceae bacterium]|nr:c-type cytochrome [Flavobacteriaceae bacterium]
MKNFKLIIGITISLGLLSFIEMQEGIWKAPAEAKLIKNPVTSSTTSIASGKKLFRSRCAVCHGTKGLGDGPGSKSLTPKPGSLTNALVQNQTDGELFWKVSNGRNDMIKWAPILTKKQRWNLVNYMRTLK